MKHNEPSKANDDYAEWAEQHGLDPVYREDRPHGGLFGRLRHLGIKPIPRKQHDGIGAIEPGTDITHKLLHNLRKRLSTLGGGKHNDPSREDWSVICAILEAGHSPQDTYATF